MKIVMIIARENFRDEELFEPKAIFEKAGIEVDVASTTTAPIKGTKGAIVFADVLVEDINVDKYDAVVFVGGAGSKQYWTDATAHKIVNDANKQDKVVAAICIAPVTLANAGVLEGKIATVWPDEAWRLNQVGVVYEKIDVYKYGNVITASGPQATTEFGETILEALSKKE